MASRFSLWALLGAARARSGRLRRQERRGEGEGGGGGDVRARLRDDDGRSRASKLPANFPKPDGVTYRQESTAGPSQVVDGTTPETSTTPTTRTSRRSTAAGYKVLFKEKEEDDAEISYEGEGTTGQVALRAVCGEDDKLVVHITNRPE